MSEAKAPNTTNKEASKLRALAAKGMLLYDAADEMCWPFQRVQYWEKRLNIRFVRGRRKMITPREEAKLRRLAAQGMKLYQAAAEMHWGCRKLVWYEQALGIKFERAIVKGRRTHERRRVSTVSKPSNDPAAYRKAAG